MLSKKEYVDGFYLRWDSKSLARDDIDIRLYKIHGSIIWYRTDKGSLVKLPIKSEEANVELITGEKASAFVLYPMQKLEYEEPLIDLLMILKEKLSHARYVFVIGYSFRDEQLRHIFWNAAKTNKDMVLILISPNACKIYETRLRRYEAEIYSELEGRVICLPYRFEKVIPFLKNTYFRYLQIGLTKENECRSNEDQRESAAWEDCIRPFIECEYIDKIEELLRRDAWKSYQCKQDMRISAQIAFKAFLTSIVTDNQNLRRLWEEELNRIFRLVSVENLHIAIINTGHDFIVSLEFRDWDNAIHFSQVKELFNTLLKDCIQKISFMKKDYSGALIGLRTTLERLGGYFGQFPSDGRVPLTDYIALRSHKRPKLHDQIEEARKQTKCQDIVASLITESEKNELKEILGGLTLRFV